jgi:hypothetical protein
MGSGTDGRSRLASLFVEHHDAGQEAGMQGGDVSKGIGWDADRDFQATEYGTRLHLRCRDNSHLSALAEMIHRPLINSTGPYAISADALCAGLHALLLHDCRQIRRAG